MIFFFCFWCRSWKKSYACSYSIQTEHGLLQCEIDARGGRVIWNSNAQASRQSAHTQNPGKKMISHVPFTYFIFCFNRHSIIDITWVLLLDVFYSSYTGNQMVLRYGLFEHWKWDTISNFFRNVFPKLISSICNAI